MKNLNTDTILAFVTLHESEKIGELHNVKEEFIATINMCAKYFLTVRKYEDCLYVGSFAAVEYDKDYLFKKSIAALNKAVNKILWLNTQCKELTGLGFIERKIDKSDFLESEALVEAFYNSPAQIKMDWCK